MRVDIVGGPEALGLLLAGAIADRLRSKPSVIVALPSGNTPREAYRILSEEVARGELSFARAQVFALDEYLGVEASDPDSFASFFRDHLVSCTDLPGNAMHVLDGTATDPQKEARRYDERIRQAGGLDLCVLGIGKNGHIAFNEPGEVLHSETHVEPLAEQTRVGLPPRLAHVRHGVTMGVGTLLRAREVLLVASGSSKAAIVQRAITGPIDPKCPASLIQLHPNARVLLDAEAASQLPQAARLPRDEAEC